MNDSPVASAVVLRARSPCSEAALCIGISLLCHTELMYTLFSLGMKAWSDPFGRK